jgi:hypothetical protein
MDQKPPRGRSHDRAARHQRPRKVSALPAFPQALPFRTCEPLRRVIQAFGPPFPPDLGAGVPPTCSLRQVVTQFTEQLDFLSADDLEWIMGRGLAECLRWPTDQ